MQGPKTVEPTLLGSSPPPMAPKRDRRCLKTSVVVLSILYVALLALFIWVAVETRDNKHDIQKLRDSLIGGTKSTYVNTASAGSSGNATLTAVSTAYPAVFLSQNATTQSGYGFAGSLYRSD